LSGQTAAKLHHYQFRTPRQVEEAFGAEVDFDQVVKLYGQYRQHDADAKYPPSPIVEVEVRTGDPDPERICTSHIERQNLTLRMQMRIFTRLTNAFSKKLTNLKAAGALHFAHYNFCHSSLRATPAMAAGIPSEIWSAFTSIEFRRCDEP